MAGTISVYFCSIADGQVISKESAFSTFQSYILDCFKNFLEEKQKIEELGDHGLIIAFARMRDLHDKETYISIVDPSNKDDKNHKIGLRPLLDYKKPDSSLPEYSFSPLLVIGLEDISQIDSHTNKLIRSLNLDPRAKYWDSSIWNRYIPLDHCLETFIKKMTTVLQQIQKNFEWELYKTNVAREFLEFQTRMMVNSQLAPVGTGGHASEVVPYKFHSESLMEIEAQKELNTLKEKNLKWRLLLVDDYGNTALQSKDDKCDKTKKYIIQKLLSTKSEDITFDIVNAVENDPSTDVIHGAIGKLSDDMYDVILLDYLLAENIQEKRREHGNELLKTISEASTDDELLGNKGPLNHFWIFPISVFSYAMLDELREQGIDHFSKHWFLASGADPVNTPSLFKFKFFQFINLQIDTAGDEKRLHGFFERILEKGRVEKQDYDDFIDLRSQFRTLKKDASKSRFATCIVKEFYKSFSDDMWEHWHHLIYLLAYDTGLEWSQMWEEFNLVKNSLVNERTRKKLEDYIIRLREQN